VDRPPRFFDERTVPQRARYVVEELGVQFLATEASAFVFLDDLREKRWR